MVGFGRPRIAVCGLNPHAGESGHLGDEETQVIAPAIARMRERDCSLGTVARGYGLRPTRSSRISTWCSPCTTTRACR